MIPDELKRLWTIYQYYENYIIIKYYIILHTTYNKQTENTYEHDGIEFVPIENGKHKQNKRIYYFRFVFSTVNVRIIAGSE